MRRSGFATGLMYVVLVLLLAALGTLIFFNYMQNTAQAEALAAEEAAAAATPTPPPTPTPEPTPVPERRTEELVLAFAGDLVGQPGLATEAADGEGENISYDFTDQLSGVVPLLRGADYASCTLVGTLSEAGPFDTGYTLPASLTAALAGAGFQAVNTATDRILERGLEGLTETVHALQSEFLVPVGAYASESAHGAFLAEIQGARVALLSYTCGTGGVSAADAPWCVDILTKDYMTDQTDVDYARVEADIAAVKDAGADFVICYIYWWDANQYYTSVRQNQADLAERLFSAGVDVLVGGGVKTPQPVEVSVVRRSDGTRANCVALYSLSNLMSCFNDRYTNLSALARVTVSRDIDTGECWVSGVECAPLFMLDTSDYTDYTDPDFRYRVLDLRGEMDAYEAGGATVLSPLAREACVRGLAELSELLGAEYLEEGGVQLDAPF